MTTAEEIGERVAQARREKAVRERRDITRREVAAAVGVSPTTVSDCEAGKQMPGESVLQKLASYLGVTPAYLRYGVSSRIVELPPEKTYVGREDRDKDEDKGSGAA